MNLENLLNIVTSWSSLVGAVSAIPVVAILKVILRYFSASVIDNKVLMTKDEQQIGSAVKEIVCYGFLCLCGFVLYLPALSFDMFSGQNHPYVAVGLLIGFLIIMGILALIKCFIKKSLSEKWVTGIAFVIAIIYSFDLILFAGVLNSPAEYALIDAYLSFVLVFCAWIVSSIQGMEYCLYLESREGEKVSEKIYVYRKVSDKFVLCGASQIEDVDKGCWFMLTDDVKKYTMKREKIKKMEEKQKGKTCDKSISENSVENSSKNDCKEMKIGTDLPQNVPDAVKRENTASDQEVQNQEL